ncbi:MAG TPA: N-acetylmuramoyl-L-alanine amidase [Clostridia bacterium]|nr:N-acetylmuramoyl-L-alanine amidase [Clostridia bacterium]
MIFGLTRFLLLCLVCTVGWTPVLGAPAKAAAPSRSSGRDYVLVTQWAKANSLKVRWLKKNETLELSSATTKIILHIRSPEAQFNAVAVRLLFPLIHRNGSVFISQLDVRHTFQPLLYPPRLRPGRSVKSICLDPGHGGRDPGYQIGSNQEKKFNLLLAQELRDQLQRQGWKVTLTRNSDSFLDLPKRPDLARRRKADLFVSLHFNAASPFPGSVQGAEVYCMTPVGAASSNARGVGGNAGAFPGNQFNDENMALAYQLQKSLTRGVPAQDRGVHRARFSVLRDATMPAVLVEPGFLSHPVEGRKIMTAAYRRQIAKAIADGLLAYKQLVERPRK